VAGGTDALGTLVAALAGHVPRWHEDAACRGSGIDFTSNAPKERAAAFELCGRCPVIRECRSWADAIDDRAAILGGEDWPARRARQKRSTRATP
jgi:hypothetical protein